uniref:Uncharacterized protein n=1 Tax=Octopus bimaculoides TaxID=37653 RepID=A0A0L8HYA9_OCTBM
MLNMSRIIEDKDYSSNKMYSTVESLKSSYFIIRVIGYRISRCLYISEIIMLACVLVQILLSSKYHGRSAAKVRSVTFSFEFIILGEKEMPFPRVFL